MDSVRAQRPGHSRSAGDVSRCIPKSLLRFLITGSLTVGVDAVVYIVLLWSGLGINLAKALGLAAATIFAYFVNRSWTFVAPHRGLRQFIAFLILYASAIGLNVGANYGVVVMLGYGRQSLILAYFVATALSATWNYLGMRYFVFRPEREPTS